MEFFRLFFSSRPVKLLLLFMLGVFVLSRDPAVQQADLFLPFETMLAKFPEPPRLPRYTAANKAETTGSSNRHWLEQPSWQENGKLHRPLDRFFAALEAARNTNLPPRTVRVLHYGDSILWGDNVTGTLRRQLLPFFGNGGRGLLPVARLFSDYELNGVDQIWTANWFVSPLDTKQLYISRQGITLRRYVSGPGGSWSIVQLKPGEEATRFGVLHDSTRTPLLITLTGRDNREYNHRIPPQAAGYTVVTNTVPFHRAKILCYPGTTLYGLTVEKERGLVYSPVIRKGIFAHDFCNLEAQLLVDQWKALRPDLLIFQFGKNEAGWTHFSTNSHRSGLEFFITNARKALPGVPILLIGPAGRMNKYGGPLRLFPTIPQIIGEQRRAATNHRTAYFNTFDALGGADAMRLLVRRGLAMTDFVHLTKQGGDLLAGILSKEFYQAWNSYRRRAGDAPSQGGGVLKYFAKPAGGKIVNAASSVNFDTVSFGFFFLIVFFTYWLLYHTGSLRVFFLLAASYFFYMSWNPIFITLIVISTLIDYVAGLLIYRARRRNRPATARIWLLLSLLSNLGFLFFFKYFNLFSDFIDRVLPGSGHLPMISLILPVGISFYTFQTMSYSLDIYRGLLRPIKSLPKFALFVSFFPQLVAGPIVRAREFIPQLAARPRFNELMMLQGIFLIMVGLFKKVVLSDYIAVNFVERVFSNPELYTSPENLLAVYGYGLQIYCDFSGYSDIAIGAAALLGFRLPLNFNSPYKAHNLQDFWHRWHISLSTWLRDYLYIPLGGSRISIPRTYVNLAVTMLIGGLWHGPSYKFILWGAIHGLGLALVRWYQRRRPPVQLTPWKRFKGVFWTFHFVMFAWIFFRAQDMNIVSQILTKIAALPSLLPELPVLLKTRILDLPGVLADWAAGMLKYIPNITLSVAAVLFGGYLLHIIPNRIFYRTRDRFVTLPVPVQTAILLLFSILLYKTATSDLVPFIYFQF